MALRTILDEHGITQRELAKAIGRSNAQVCRLVNGGGTRQEVVLRLLGFLRKRTKQRNLSYEDVFGAAS